MMRHPALLLLLALVIPGLCNKTMDCHSVDFLKIGMHKNDVVKMYGHVNARINADLPDGLEAQIIEIFREDQVIFTAEVKKDTVWRITVYHKMYKTPGGLAVGDPYRAVKKVYQKPRLYFSEIHLYARGPDDCFSFSFGMQGDSIPDEARVKNIRFPVE